jgi:hypothetical protein
MNAFPALTKKGRPCSVVLAVSTMNFFTVNQQQRYAAGFCTRIKVVNYNTKQKGARRNPNGLSPRKRKACHRISTALLKSVAKIGTQSTMKSSRKTLHEFTSHISPRTSKGN